MKDYTISTLLAMQKSLATRRNQLSELKNEVSRKVTWFESTKKTEEPVYDFKSVDLKLSEINKALFHLDQVIKEANASTKVSIDIDYDSLMSSLV